MTRSTSSSASCTESGLIVAKFWLQVSKAEQLRRFKARDEDPLKRFKVDPEDWTNRTFYDAYQAAAAEMVQRTHTRQAHWNVCGR
jgi:polyphosphate kinase 2 (PPK2 family)